jgi:hypothetical protein
MQKKWFYKSALLFVFFALTVMQGSSSEDYYYEYYAVYMDRKDLAESVFYLPEGKEMKNPGNIYYKYPYLLVNEIYKGELIFNNHDPANPRKEGFIVAPGCLDMAIKDNIIYLDNAVDLVAFDYLANGKEKKEVNRIPGILPEPTCPDNFSLWYGNDRPPGEYVIVEWIKRKSNQQ